MNFFHSGVALRCIPVSLLAVAAHTHAAQPSATPMCQTIQAWVNTDSRTMTGAAADDLAGSLLGPTFAQAFGKDYSQLTVADFRVLQDQGLSSCSRTGVLQAGQMRIANTLLNPSYQSRWLARGGGQATLAPAPLANANGSGRLTSARGLAPAQAQPNVGGLQSNVGVLQPSGGQTGLVRTMTAVQPQGTLGSQTNMVAPSTATQSTATPSQSLKGIGSDLKSSLSGAFANIANQAVGAGTQAVTDRVTNLASGGAAATATAPAAAPAPAKTAVSCPSAADMEVIRRTGSKPPEGC